MRKSFILSAAGLLFVIFTIASLRQTAFADETPKSNGFIVKMKRGVPVELFAAAASVLNYKIERAEPLLKGSMPDAFKAKGFEDVYVINGSAEGGEPAKFAALLYSYASDSVVYVEPDYIGFGGGTPNDPLLEEQYSLDAVEKSGINLIPAFDYTMGSKETIIAVLDSGINKNHEEFTGKYITGYNYASNNEDVTDDHGHGSNVSGIAAANTNNGKGMVGVCPKCKILVYKVLNSSNSGQYSWWVSALADAVEAKASVINMSLGGSQYSETMEDAVDATYESGVIIVACMMNANNSAVYYPAGYKRVIAVGATNEQGKRASPFSWGGGSNYGPHIWIVAPGNNITGPTKTGQNFQQWSGTSQATPHVTGVIALMRTLVPGLTFEEARQILAETAEDRLGAPSEDVKGFDNYYGYGRLNAYEAVKAAAAMAGIDGDDDAAELESELETAETAEADESAADDTLEDLDEAEAAEWEVHVKDRKSSSSCQSGSIWVFAAALAMFALMKSTL